MSNIKKDIFRRLLCRSSSSGAGALFCLAEECYPFLMAVNEVVYGNDVMG